MGKIRRERKKFHTSTATAKDKDDEKMCIEEDPAEPKWESHATNTTYCKKMAPKVLYSIKLSDNVFSSIKIVADDLLKQKLPEFDEPKLLIDAPVAKATKRPRLPKKKRAKLGHELLLQKLEATRENITNGPKSKKKQKKKKKKKANLSDMQTLVEALPDVEEESSKTVGHKKSREEKIKRSKPIKKSKSREKERLENLKMFRRVLKHPAFKADPAGTISLHIKNKIQLENSAKPLK